jgi:hypothetical protein
MTTFQLEVAILVVIGGGLTLYWLLGGADFGGGVWDLLAIGPTRERERALISDAIGPVWEANHVWLIFVVTGLLAAFPAAFASLGFALYVPFSIAIAGIVFRGAAFAFRSWGDQVRPLRDAPSRDHGCDGDRRRDPREAVVPSCDRPQGCDATHGRQDGEGPRSCEHPVPQLR